MSFGFRLAHLSDPHLRSTTLRGAEWLGKRGLGGLSLRAGRAARQDPQVVERVSEDVIAAAPDAIAVTGDVVTFSLRREFEAAAAWLDRLAEAAPVLVVPGNHEALATGWRRRMAAAWRHHGGGDAGETFPYLQRFGSLGLIALSTATVTPPFMASGRVGRRARATLGTLVARTRDEGRLPVVLMHHPPTRLTSRRKALVDDRAVREVLARAGVALVLHGHTHAAALSWIDGRFGRSPVLGAPSAGHPAAAGGGWRLVTFGADARGWRVEIEPRTVRPDESVHGLTPLCLRLPGPDVADARPAPILDPL